MKGYKGFSHGLICRGKQYAENTVFEEDDAKICKSGMHFCARPIDVLRYYPPCDEHGNPNDFCVVEALDDAVTDDKKIYCTRKLKVGEKIGLDGLINAEVEHIMSDINEINEETKAVNSGYRSAAISIGGSSAAVNSGEEGVAASLGINEKAKAALGGWIVLTEWKLDEIHEEWHRVDLKSAQVDGKKIKADTWYILKNGEFVEDKNDNDR